MLTIYSSTQFKKDLKRAEKRGSPMASLAKIIKQLASGEPLLPKHRDHALTGNWAHYRECHILPDWLLIYSIDENENRLDLARTGTHSDLF